MRESASSSPDGACKKEACAIQACLSKKNYNPDACTDEIEKLKRCCEGVQVSARCVSLDLVSMSSILPKSVHDDTRNENGCFGAPGEECSLRIQHTNARMISHLQAEADGHRYLDAAVADS